MDGSLRFIIADTNYRKIKKKIEVIQIIQQKRKTGKQSKLIIKDMKTKMKR